MRTTGTRDQMTGDRATRRWLDEVERYLREVTDMRDVDSNSVYVVSLNRGRREGWDYGFIDIVARLGRYFFATSSSRCDTPRRCRVAPPLQRAALAR